jgi:hypothetical protein
VPEDITPGPEGTPAADPAEQTPEETLLAGKYKSAEELEKAYKSLESKLGQLGEEKAAYESQLEDLYGRVQQMEAGAQQAAYDPSSDPTLLAYERAMEMGDYKAALAIQAGLMQTIAQQQQGAASAGKPDSNPQDYETWAFVAEQTALQQIGPDEWAKYKDRVAEEASNENFDNLSAAQAGQKLARIYKMVKADDVLNTQQTLAEQQADADREAKLAAQSMSGASGRPPAPTKNEAEVGAIIKAAREGSYENLILGG